MNHGFKYDHLEFKTLWSSPVTFWNLENLNFRALSFQFCKCSCHMFMTWSLPFSTAILTFWARSCYISINYRSTVYTYQNQIFHLIFSLPFSVNVKTAETISKLEKQRIWKVSETKMAKIRFWPFDSAEKQRLDKNNHILKIKMMAP